MSSRLSYRRPMNQPQAQPHPGRTRRRRLAAGALVMSALAITACGSRTASPPVAHAPGSSTTTTSAANALVIAGRCLRHHGIPNLPDPTIATSGPAKGETILDKQVLVAVPNSVFTQALLACHTALEEAGFQSGPNSPANPQEIRYLLAFARCVRHHGISNFPDPNSQGGINLAGTGINGHDLTPTQLSVARTCLPTAHGDVHIPTQGTGTNGGGQ